MAGLRVSGDAKNWEKPGSCAHNPLPIRVSRRDKMISLLVINSYRSLVINKYIRRSRIDGKNDQTVGWDRRLSLEK
jgi:hypothetical protein